MDSWLRQDRDQISRSVIGGETLLSERTRSQPSLGNTLGTEMQGLTIDVDNPSQGEALANSAGLKRGNILAQTRVYYLGFGTPSEGEPGIEMMQEPLGQLYQADDGRRGEPGWLVALEDGIQFQPKDRDEPIWIPTQNIRICAALQRQADGNFVDLDSVESGSAYPIFSIVKERTDAPDENHAFVCSSRQAALAMVRAASYSYSHKEGWSDVQYGYYFKKVTFEKRIEVPSDTSPVGDFGPAIMPVQQRARSLAQIGSGTSVVRRETVPIGGQQQIVPAGGQQQVVTREVCQPDGTKILVRERHIYRQQAPQKKVVHVHKVKPAPVIPVAPPPVVEPPMPQPPPQIIIVQKQQEEPAPITIVRTVEEPTQIIHPVQHHFIERHPCDPDFSYVPAPAADLRDYDTGRIQMYQHGGYMYDYDHDDEFRTAPSYRSMTGSRSFSRSTRDRH